MNVRSVTLFTGSAKASARAEFFRAAREAFEVPVQSTRVAAPPIPEWAQDTDRARTFIASWSGAGADYLSLGCVGLQHPSHWLDRLLTLIGENDHVFASAEVADRSGRIDHGRARELAALVKALSSTHTNGFGNLYFTVLANCPPEIPFFPAAYSSGAEGFGLALEAADVTLEAVENSLTLEQARTNIVAAVEREARHLVASAQRLEERFGIPFRGIDFSYAPYPTPDKSVAATMEGLGLSPLGANGSVFAAAFLTEALSQANFPRCGFNGLMLPVLEDDLLARRAVQSSLDVQKLLLYSTVCGVGLDTVPLPGDVPEGELAALFLDLAALATRLDKPLTARVMPIPGLSVGDPVSFDFPFFSDGAVMPINTTPSTARDWEDASTVMRPYRNRMSRPATD